MLVPFPDSESRKYNLLLKTTLQNYGKHSF